MGSVLLAASSPWCLAQELEAGSTKKNRQNNLARSSKQSRQLAASAKRAPRPTSELSRTGSPSRRRPSPSCAGSPSRADSPSRRRTTCPNTSYNNGAAVLLCREADGTDIGPEVEKVPVRAVSPEKAREWYQKQMDGHTQLQEQLQAERIQASQPTRTV